MKWVRGLAAGGLLLLSLPGCSNKNDVTNVIGSYAPVIVRVELNQAPLLFAGVAAGHEPAVRDSINQIRVEVQNPNGIALTYHWTASAGQLLDSTAATVRWRAPHELGGHTLTVAVEGTDSNEQYYYRVRAFTVYVDAAYVRWTRTQTTQFDPAPRLSAGDPYTGPLLYSEFASLATGETGVWSLDGPGGSPTLLTPTFFQASSPSLRADGAEFAFSGRKRLGDAATVFLLPAAGGDTAQARRVSTFNSVFNSLIAKPRFSPSGTILLYHSDSLSFGNPKPWVRDVSNFFLPPARVIKVGQQPSFAWWNANWRAAGDSVVTECYRFFSGSREYRGLFKLLAIPPYQETNTPPLVAWLPDLEAFDPDWSPDGQHVVFTRKNASEDRDIWIIRSDTSDKAQAIRVTSGVADDAQPRFSSDGSAIYFISNRIDRYGSNGVFGVERRGTNIWSVSRFDKP